MPDDATEKVIIYNGSELREVDDKRRLQIPARWRPSKDTEFTMVYWPKHPAGPCLRVFPLNQFLKLVQKIDTMENTDVNKGVLLRSVGEMSIQVRPDTAGRVCIPQELADKTGITNQARVAGCLTRFEIWKPETYEKVRGVDQLLAPRAYDLLE
jgi:MraZ protein